LVRLCIMCAVLIVLSRFFFVFFFSSRRRHTRCYRDWSSDVCSSDLSCRLALHSLVPFSARKSGPAGSEALHHTARIHPRPVPERSEERSVGKECRSRWSREQ